VLGVIKNLFNKRTVRIHEGEIVIRRHHIKNQHVVFHRGATAICRPAQMQVSCAMKQVKLDQG
jgi:hypothetical protein